jgi:hypothetical protein
VPRWRYFAEYAIFPGDWNTGETYMIRKLALILLFIVPVPVLAQICPVSNKVPTPDDGIGDGCSLTYSGVNLGWLVPDLALFKSTFTPACDFHDKCWTQLGADYGSCDSQFLSKMKDRCDSQFDPILATPVNLQCKVTANMYKQGVEWYRNNYPERITSFQYEALSRSYALRATVGADGCGTTPDGTTLYAPALINTINNAFLSGAGRQPTIYEFLEAANAGDIVGNLSGWQTLLYTQAAQAAAVQPPAVVWTAISPEMQTYNFRVTNPVANNTYMWKMLPGLVGLPVTTYTGPNVNFTFNLRGNATLQFKGFLKATNLAGVRNMSVVNRAFQVIVTCGGPRGQSCE